MSARSTNPAPRRRVEHAQRAGYVKASPPRDHDPGLIVHQHEIGLDRQSKCDHGALTAIQFGSPASIAASGVRPHIEPSGHLRYPCAHRRRCLGIGEFVPHGLRRHHAPEQFG